MKKIWDGLPVFTQETIYHEHIEMKQSLCGCLSISEQASLSFTCLHTSKDRFSHDKIHLPLNLCMGPGQKHTTLHLVNMAFATKIKILVAICCKTALMTKNKMDIG